MYVGAISCASSSKLYKIYLHVVVVFEGCAMDFCEIGDCLSGYLAGWIGKAGTVRFGSAVFVLLELDQIHTLGVTCG